MVHDATTGLTLLVSAVHRYVGFNMFDRNNKSTTQRTRDQDQGLSYCVNILEH